jgi:DNA-binding winged helix-turn-helix (wHTH) protein
LEFVFGDHALDLDRRELRRGAELVALEPQVFDLLVYLVRNRERVVSKDDLLEAIWGGRIVSESTMTSRINAARKAVGDSGKVQCLIRTIPRKGIRFVGIVREEEKAAAPVNVPPVVAAHPPISALALPDKPSIAVLPFENLSGDPEQKYFAEGVVDEIISALSRIPGLFVMARNSIGAAIGREFPYALMHAVSRLPEDELKASLTGLVTSELVFQRGTPPDAIYTFKHALVQDVAHSSLLRASRQQLHARIAEALASYSPELMDTQPELFAQHYAEAGLLEESVACWCKAGRRSAARSAMAEAAAQFRKGLDPLALLLDTPERQRQELELRSGLGAALGVVKGFGAPETGHAFARARELWEQLGSPSDFLRIPYG